jgi:(E)-4-hydroxy-3-methylbut-2-enyl-diphosphate synthase
VWLAQVPKSLVYRNGEKSHFIPTDKLVDEIEAMVRQKVAAEEEKQAKIIVKG